jgi:UDP-glucose 6-dehydrogenase
MQNILIIDYNAISHRLVDTLVSDPKSRPDFIINIEFPERLSNPIQYDCVFVCAEDHNNQVKCVSLFKDICPVVVRSTMTEETINALSRFDNFVYMPEFCSEGDKADCINPPYIILGGTNQKVLLNVQYVLAYSSITNEAFSKTVLIDPICTMLYKEDYDQFHQIKNL